MVTVAVVALALLVVARPRPYLSARAWGGPTEGAAQLSLRVRTSEHYAGAEAPVALSALEVRARAADGRQARWSGPVGARGFADVLLPFQGGPLRGPVSLSLATPGVELALAEGEVELTVEQWRAAARRRGGWLHGSVSGVLSVRVAAERGVFAVPFRDPLRIAVQRDGAPVSGAAISIEGDSVDLEPGPRITDAQGELSIRLAPTEFVAALGVRATGPDGASGAWSGTLPVLPGALHATLERARLVVRSPIVREVGFFAIVSEDARRLGGTLSFAPDAGGGARASVTLPAELLRGAPLWAVVSSELDLRSQSAVGWPLHTVGPGGAPPQTFTVPDRLLLDGSAQGAERERQRRERARLLAGVVSAVGALLVALLVIDRVRTSRERLAEHLNRTSGGQAAALAAISGGRSLFWLVVAVLCIALGFAVVTLIAMYRMG